MAQNFGSMLEDKGFNVVIKKEVEITKSDVNDTDLCISFGGDNTFLNTASKITNPYKTAIFGVNSFPKHQRCNLCDVDLDYNAHKQ